MKLVLGTAQFGMSYGLNRKPIDIKEIKNIAKILFEKNLFLFDTAIDYGISEKTLGDFKFTKKVITKIRLPLLKPKSLRIWFYRKIRKSLKRLNVNKLHSLLVHDIKNILGNEIIKKEFLELIKEVKRKKIASNIGVSVYDPIEIDYILKIWRPDIVQIPINVLDNRFLKNGILRKLKNKGILVCARSVFLQGILLQKNLKIGNKKTKKIFNKFNAWCNYNKISRLDACIHFLRNISFVDYMIVGVNDCFQLKEIINSFKKKKIFIPKNFSCMQKSVIDPRRWKKI